MINNDNFLLKDIPKFHPIIQKWERLNYWKAIKRKVFEGEWSGNRWCPPELYYHINLSTIQFLGGGRKVSGIGRPWFRDIEWSKAYIYSEACGFSGFRDDPKYTCLEAVQVMSKEEIYKEFCLDHKGNKLEDVYTALFKKNGSLKEYWPARTYFWRSDMSEKFGPHMYLNQAKNVIDMEGRGSGKSYWSASCIQHSLITDGARSYDAYLRGRKEKQFVSLSQTLVGAIEAKYSSDLLSKVRFSLDNLPGEITVQINGDDRTFPSPLMPKLGGSWEAGAKNPLHDSLSGSSIVHRTFQDNPLAANGTRPTRAFLEEVGFIHSIHEVLGAVEATQPNKQSNKYLPIYMLGTGGYTTTGTALWLKEIFYNPAAFDCLVFEDQWENKGEIGYFLPATKGMNDFKEGLNLVSNEERALKSIEAGREKARKSNNKIKLLTEIINQPLKPSEVFMTLEGNLFPIEDLKTVLEKLEASPHILNSYYKYEMQIVDGRVVPKLSTKVPVRDFPLKKGINIDAPIEVFELPQRNKDGEVFSNRYIAGWDPIDVDDNADSTQSLQSLFVLDTWTDRIVAEYTSRTYLAKEYYEQARRLLIYYNAICNYEQNLKGAYAHFSNKNSLHLLCDTPEILSDKSLSTVHNVGNKSKGTRVGGNSAGNKIITFAENELLAYLDEESYDDEEKRNLDIIPSVGLLRELIGYSRELNTDRVSAFNMLMILRADRDRITQVSKTQSVKTKSTDSMWFRAYNKNYKSSPNYQIKNGSLIIN